jgi:hypothetical protein
MLLSQHALRQQVQLVSPMLQQQMDNSLLRFVVCSLSQRAYPDLKASANFLALQEELSTTENKVSFARQFYNDTVRSLNQAVKTFPSSLFTSIAKVSARAFYEVENPTDRNVPNVKF